MATKMSQKRQRFIIPVTIKSSIDEAKGLLKGGKSTREIMKEIKKEERRYEQNKVLST